MHLSRRDIIRWGLAGLGAMSLGCFEGAGDTVDQVKVPDVTPPETLLAPKSTRLLGKAVLETMTASERNQAFANLLNESPTDGAAFAAYIRDRHRRDLAEGLFRKVDGWLLSATEAVFYAYVAHR